MTHHFLGARPNFASQFSEAFTPAFQKGMDRFLEQSGERKKEERQLAQRKLQAQALGLDESITDPALMAAVYKENAKDKRDAELLAGFGLGNQTSPLPGNKNGLESPMNPQEGSQGQFDPGAIPDEFINRVAIKNPQLGSFLQQQKSNAEKLRLKKEQHELEPIKSSVSKWFDKASEEMGKLNEQELSLDAMRQGILSGSVDPFSPAHLGEIAHAFGVPEEITRSWGNMNSKEFGSARKVFLSNLLKGAFRGATTGREIQLADTLLSQVGISKEANLAAEGLMRSGVMMNRERQRLLQEAKELGLSNYKIPDYVDKKADEYGKLLNKQYIEALEELKRRLDAEEEPEE